MAWMCSRCLRLPLNAPSLHPLPSRSSRAAFSTSAASLASPPRVRPGASSTPKRGSKQTFSPKRKDARIPAKARSPERGARRMMRKKLVLSNANALDVPRMEELSLSSISQLEKEGKVMAIPSALVERLRTVGAFQYTQGWKYFKRPCTLIRKETRDLVETMNEIGSSPSQGRAHRTIVVGERGSGKSMHILHAMTSAFLKDWVVIHIPDAQELTNAHTDYALLPDISPPTYIQKSYTAGLLARILTANPILKTLQITQKHELPMPLPPKTTLARLCSIGADHALAHPVFLALISELSAPGRPPLLLSLDGLFHAMRLSEYRSASFEPIHAHSLFLISWFLSYLRGHATLPNGGLVMAATSESNCPSVPTLRSRLAQLEAQQAWIKKPAPGSPKNPITPFLEATGQEVPAVEPLDPYYRFDGRVLEALNAPGTIVEGNDISAFEPTGKNASTFEILRLQGLKVEEARSLMEYWTQSGLMKSEVNNRLSAEKWIISGSGLVGELERGCVRVAA